MEAPFKIGDYVTTTYITGHEHVVRKVTDIQENKRFGSGFSVSADDGGKCPYCMTIRSVTIWRIDSAWFKLAEV